MRLTILLPLAALLGCTKPSPPAPAPTIYAELVASGCLAPSPEGPQAVADTLDAGIPWLDCLVDGGSVVGCGVPCGAPVTP